MRILSFDTETSIGSTIHESSFRDPNNDIYTQIFARSETEVKLFHNEHGFKRKLSIDVSKYDVIIGHNLSFDLCYVIKDDNFRKFMLNGGVIWDTQVAEYHLTGQQHIYSSLAELQLKHLGEVEKPSRISKLYKKKIGADKIVQARYRCKRLWKLYESYCKSDGTTPIKIYHQQVELAKREGMYDIIKLYNDYLLALIISTTSGIKVDLVKCEKTMQSFKLKSLEYLKEAQELLKKYWTDPRLPDFKISSNDHKSAVLFGGEVKCVERRCVGDYKNGKTKFKNFDVYVKIDGFRVPSSLTNSSKKSGVYRVDAKVMQKIEQKTKNPLLKRYCFLQKESAMYKKAAVTYCQAFLDRNVNSYLYPNYNNVATTTGRLSSSDPNLQNVSKKNKFGKDLHSLFIAEDGWTCVEIDFSQLEIWVLAYLSGDEQLYKDMTSGIDMHCMRLQYYNTDKTYEEIYHLCKVAIDEFWDSERSKAKVVSYQKAYGAGIRKIALETGLSEDVVKMIFEKEDAKYWQAAAFSTSVRDDLQNNVDFSYSINIPFKQKGTNKDCSRIENGKELLPIFDKSGEVYYTNEYRKVGYWRSVTGRKYHFLSSGRASKYGIRSSFSFTQPKNYPMQGTAADIQGVTSAALRRALILKEDKIRFINEIHDSKLFYVRTDVLQPCLKWLKEIIEDVPKHFKERLGIEVPFKFPVGIKTGSNFGDMHEYKV